MTEQKKREGFITRFRKSPAHTQVSIISSGIVAVATVIYSVFAGLQLLQIRRTNDLTQQALNGNTQALNQTLAEMDGQSEQTSRLADETHIANQNILEADRPWLGASFALDQEIATNNSPTMFVVFLNSGKRPARVTSVEVQPNWFTVFPKNPPYGLDASRKSSASFMVPGAQLVMKLRLINGKITDGLMAQLRGEKSYYVYAKIEYLDVRNSSVHYTHACWKYSASLTPSTPAGFYNCSTEEGYTDAN